MRYSVLMALMFLCAGCGQAPEEVSNAPAADVPSFFVDDVIEILAPSVPVVGAVTDITVRSGAREFTQFA